MFDGTLFENNPDYRYRCGGQHECERHGKAGHLVERDHHHGTNHDEIALGKVHHTGGILDQAESQGNERIDAAVRDAGYEKLREKMQKHYKTIGDRRLAMNTW